jgi:lysophospholipase L1-like esterase
MLVTPAPKLILVTLSQYGCLDLRFKPSAREAAKCAKMPTATTPFQSQFDFLHLLTIWGQRSIMRQAREDLLKTYFTFGISAAAVVLACGLASSGIRATDAFASNLAGEPNAAAIPTHKWLKRHEWLAQHERFVAIAKEGNFDLLFLGDSITDFWRSRGKAAWERNFAPLRAENFGISGDYTQNVLWRVQHGELDGAHPRLVVLMIGTNNTRTDAAEDIASGIATIVKAIQAKSSTARVLLLAILPRANTPDEKEREQINQKIREVNKIISGLDDGKSVKYLDIGARFLNPDGTLPKSVMPDLLHPNDKGYQVLADAILPTVKDMMR